jgi:hypothetical protein
MALSWQEGLVPVIRTDFADDAAWAAVCAALGEPEEELGLVAPVDCISDRRYEGLSVEALVALVPPESPVCMVVADRRTLTDPERPLIIVDLDEEPGQSFRALPSTVAAIEANLSIANMDFFAFADSVNPDGVFRGFPHP